MVDLKKCSAHQPDSEPLALDLIERMFFGYRDFVGVADELLATIGYGRAHHRVLHFVDRNPGLTVGDLLGILKVTKQGVARVLKTLVDDGFITVRQGVADRREKCLATTAKGHDLARTITAIQTEKIHAALEAAGPANRDAIAMFLAALVDEDERADVLSRIAGGV
ncbi:MarR family transcriptional regulator [Acuticoccus sp. MNP-M23]|uniref:MarR family winged helix-turn-helix transcriptional regulator n=1 Tax=Acuticoccus sp. MNP-M23 TaxID=3072793 RepID=UPI0028160681|nr:MarR family transcriptional regulator [Acuticoccus sp. MNP-M23]WMS43677.1 MarR family transcriptional regulator [Acuticoccus sp. MNP-M23]